VDARKEPLPMSPREVPRSALVKALRRAEIVMRSAGGQIPVPGSVHASLLAQADKVRRLLDRLKK
jgi:hypothetical protein